MKYTPTKKNQEKFVVELVKFTKVNEEVNILELRAASIVVLQGKLKANQKLVRKANQKLIEKVNQKLVKVLVKVKLERQLVELI